MKHHRSFKPINDHRRWIKTYHCLIDTCSTWRESVTIIDRWFHQRCTRLEIIDIYSSIDRIHRESGWLISSVWLSILTKRSHFNTITIRMTCTRSGESIVGRNPWIWNSQFSMLIDQLTMNDSTANEIVHLNIVTYRLLEKYFQL